MLIRSTVLLDSHYLPPVERVVAMLILVRQKCVVQVEDLEKETMVILMVTARTVIPSAMC